MSQHHGTYDAPEVVVEDGLHPRFVPSQGKGASQEYTVGVGNDTKPRSRKSLWIIFAACSVLAVGAIIGGVVGGIERGKSNTSSAVTTTIISPATSSSQSTQTDSTSSSSTSTSQSAPTSSSLVTTDCPSSNGTTHTPLAPDGATGSYTFVKYCGFDTTIGTITEAFVPSFDDCIDMCSDFNYVVDRASNCTSVTFLVDGAAPGNCYGKGPSSVLVASSDAESALLLT